MHTKFFSTLAFTVLSAGHAAAQPAEPILAKDDDARRVYTVGGRPIATYVYRDARTPRPYFTHLCTPAGATVTRNHPPVPGKDAVDHADMHPGLWLAFGDIGGADNWRLKSPVRHVGFQAALTSNLGKAAFAVKNHYLAADGKTVICEETARYAIHIRPGGYLFFWDATVRAAADFNFGDQEEMGLGIRVATPLTVKAGGKILTSDGHVNEKQVRGKTSAWCDYSGTIDGKSVGITLMQHPKNFRPAWYHARDYGLLVANPFGRNALTGGETSRVNVMKGASFRLRFGVFIHDKADIPEAYRDYLAQTKDD